MVNDDIHNLRRQMPNGGKRTKGAVRATRGAGGNDARSRVSHSFETLTRALGVHKPMVRERTA